MAEVVFRIGGPYAASCYIRVICLPIVANKIIANRRRVVAGISEICDLFLTRLIYSLALTP